MELPLIIKRCLAHGIQILPYELYNILHQYELKKIPDEILNTMPIGDLKKYTRALFLCGEEMAGDWTRGHSMLKELGFVESVRSEGHRNFVSLVFTKDCSNAS